MEDSDVPICRRCNGEMILFFQMDLPPIDLGIGAGGHLVLMMCPACNEIPSFEFSSGGKLPVNYWEVATEGHYYAAMFRPDAKLNVARIKPILENRELLLEPRDTASINDFRVGGAPTWLQRPVSFECQCGNPMQFICQLSENYGFRARVGALGQPDSFSNTEYCLFLGNSVYLFVCAQQCTPRSVWIAVQN